jgi:mono/diheme cytochrome c family protein
MTGSIAFLLSLTFYTTLYGNTFTKPQDATGMALYKQNCVRCHGTNGRKGFLGAKDLSKSILADPEIIQKIRDGRGFMPSFKKKLSVGEIEAIVVFVKGLRPN